jgi:PAS domain-containing protein
MEGVQIINHDWRYLYVNNAIVTQGIYSKKERLGYTMMEKFSGIEHTEMFKLFKRCLKEKEPNHFENEFKFPNWSLRWFEMSIVKVPEGLFILRIYIIEKKKAEQHVIESETFSSALLSSLNSHNDITTHKLAEQTKKVVETKYIRLFETAKDGILILNADTGKIEDVNPFLIEILGFPYNYFIGKRLWEIGVFKDEESFKGSGLDMYIVKETVAKLNGTITSKSKLAIVSTFTITIPNSI